MQKADLKTKIVILAVIIIAVITIGTYIYKKSKEEDEIIYSTEALEYTENTEDYTLEKKESIIIHVAGEVQYPGVVVLKNGDRIVDAINAAGGETENADLNKLNLAYILNDGDKIYVPNKNEENTEQEKLENMQDNEQTTININTATTSELATLPGIGETTANKIVEYRKKNGKFKTIEELKNVPGIGDRKFESLKDKISAK